MLASFDTVTTRLHTNQADVGFIDEISKHADGIRTAANTGDNGIRQATFSFQNLRFGFFANHPLKLTDNGRIRMRASRGAQHIVRGFITAGPVA
ncbi:Uncharacterised protein [Shigella flexneri]|nr:Uncharacterised protein [Shigella flexneri]